MQKISIENIDSAMVIILRSFKFDVLPQIRQSVKLRPSPKFPAVWYVHLFPVRLVLQKRWPFTCRGGLSKEVLLY